MAPFRLLTPEQAQHNKAVFERVAIAAKLPPRTAQQSSVRPLRDSSTASSGIANAISVAYEHKSARLSGLDYPPPPPVTIFSDPAYHVYVLSTFIATAMSTVGYVPNAVNESTQEQTTKLYSFLEELSSDTYRPYLESVASPESQYGDGPISCTSVLDAVRKFIQQVEETVGAEDASKVSAEITNMIVSAVMEFMSSSAPEKTVEKTEFSVFKINGETKNFPYPVATILWSRVYLKRTTDSSGKSTTVYEYQEINMMSSAYMINSPAVVANAAELAQAFQVSPTQLVEAINTRSSVS